MFFQRARDISRDQQRGSNADRNPGLETDWDAYPTDSAKIPLERAVRIVYLNHRGMDESRNIVPDRLWFGATDWYVEKQWLLDAFDIDRGVFQTLAVSRIVNMGDTDACVFDGSPAQRASGRLSVSG